jgi:hypothetical protein
MRVGTFGNVHNVMKLVNLKTATVAYFAVMETGPVHRFNNQGNVVKVRISKKSNPEYEFDNFLNLYASEEWMRSLHSIRQLADSGRDDVWI